MRVFYSESFKKDFQSLPKEIQKITERKLRLFVQNFRHPSLRVKKMEGLQNIWEGSITKSYRFTFLIKNNICILRRVGTHDILKKEKQR